MISEWRAVARKEEELADAGELLIMQPGPPVHHWPNPRHALSTTRSQLAGKALHGHREAARELAAWWADLATVAMLATVLGRSLHPVRAAAGSPAIIMSAEELRMLPPVREYDRNLARLTAYTAPDEAQRYAARVGLRVKASPDGKVVVADDGDPEGRRCRLWGTDWVDHRVPLMPGADELAGLLTGYGAPAQLVASIRSATQAVNDVLAACRHVRGLEKQIMDEASADAHAEAEESTWHQREELTELLAGYARTLTISLPAIRAAVVA